MKFISVFLERPRILFLTLAFILLSGISSLLSVPIQENPELAERWGNVSVFYPGASPERIETQVINDLEIKLREIVEIDELDSIISQDYSKTHIELEQIVPFGKIEETLLKEHCSVQQVHYYCPKHLRHQQEKKTTPILNQLFQWSFLLGTMV